MKKLMIVMILSVALVGCKTKEYVPVVEHHTDTLYRSRTDSVPVPYPVTKEVKKPLTLIEKALMGTGIASIVGLLFYFFIYIRKLLP